MAAAAPVVPDVAATGYTRTAVAALADEGRARTTDRIAFRTRSDDEVLDDGYKWRKYGKKTVKNSPNPRNYYRCSTEGCTVKKRVERDRNDPRYVVTMYEGRHSHVCPGTVYYAAQDAASGRFFVAGMHHPDLN
ncbi:probable WRKY transcription factor 50 [Oryza brachyantha]|uniref:probable WRKY transcription factor 50 n=1 Tax=Oryza brachyantha TaxID=4533 RepID=UPI001AD9F98D|nr:probable WRKY transcription factor 50 [Oryza brachyantha]